MSNVPPPIEILTDERTGCYVEINYDPCPESPREWSNVFQLCLESREYELKEIDFRQYVHMANDAISERLGEIEAELEELDENHPDYDGRCTELLDERAGLIFVTDDGLELEREVTMKDIEAQFDGRIYPVYAYIHSGIALSTTNRRYPFNDVWDSGLLGYAMVSNATIHEEFEKYYPDGRWCYADDPGGDVTDHGDVNDWLHSVLVSELENLEDYWGGNVYCLDAYLPDGEDAPEPGFCGIYDHECWKEDSYLNTEARALLAETVAHFDLDQSNGMKAIDLFDQAELVLA